MITVSPSLIGMLLECPRCLWLHFKENVRRPSGPFPSLPGGMDGVLKTYFDGYRKKGALPPEIEGRVSEKLFDGVEKLNEWRNNRVGIKWEFPVFEIILKGAIDELLVNDAGELVVFDFKTRGWPTKEDSHRYYQTQLNLYALLFGSNGYEVADYGYLLFFWPEKYEKGGALFKTDLVKMRLDPASGLKTLEEVHKIIKSEKPPANENCGFCRYRTD